MLVVQGEDFINFDEFLMALKNFCRSTDEELDKLIFNLFDLRDKNFVSLKDMTMMLMNFPDMGFTCPSNLDEPDRFYQDIKKEIINTL